MFYKTSTVWVADFLYEGRPRRWFKAMRAGADAQREIEALLQDWYGDHARLVSVRPATKEEDLQYIRGELPRNVYCPTGR
jgi:uncharacterized DUF497 family protein